MEQDKDILTMREAAKLSKCTISAISASIKKKRLRAKKENDRWYIQKEDLDHYHRTRHSRQYSTYQGKPLYDKTKGEYSAVETAKLLNTNTQMIYYHLRMGRLPYKKRRASYVIQVEDINRLRKELK